MNPYYKTPNPIHLDLSPWHCLAAAMLWRAARDATDADVRMAAGARLWLLFGLGARLAELCGVDCEIHTYVKSLPLLPGQVGGPVALDLARLI